MEVSWQLAVKEAKGGFDLLFVQLVEIDQAGRERHLGVFGRQRQEADVARFLQEPLFVLVFVGLVAKDYRTGRQVQRQMLEAFEVVHGALTDEELDGLPLCGDKQMHLEIIEEPLFAGLIAAQDFVFFDGEQTTPF